MEFKLEKFEITNGFFDKKQGLPEIKGSGDYIFQNLKIYKPLFLMEFSNG